MYYIRNINYKEINVNFELYVHTFFIYRIHRSFTIFITIITTVVQIMLVEGEEANA